jgi:hypothetical protein
LNQDVKRVSFLIHCPPEVGVLAVDGEHPLVQVPLVPAFRLLPSFSSLGNLTVPCIEVLRFDET